MGVLCLLTVLILLCVSLTIKPTDRVEAIIQLNWIIIIVYLSSFIFLVIGGYGLTIKQNKIYISIPIKKALSLASVARVTK